MVTGERFSFTKIRNVVIFLAGLFAFIFEVLSGGERYTILLLAAAAMGLPQFLGMDERRRDARAAEKREGEE